MAFKELAAYCVVNGLTIARPILGFLASQSISSSQWGNASGYALLGVATEVDGTLAERFDVASEFGFKLDCLCDAIYGTLIINELTNQILSIDNTASQDFMWISAMIMGGYFTLVRAGHRRHTT